MVLYSFFSHEVIYSSVRAYQFQDLYRAKWLNGLERDTQEVKKMEDEEEVIDYEENLREKHLEQKLIEERLKEVAHKQELLKKLRSERRCFFNILYFQILQTVMINR